jgi:serine/threonine protein kinase
MAEVHLALDEGHAGAQRLVVIKRLLPELAGDYAFASMFLREVRIAMRLGHPHIGHIYDVGEHEGRHFLAMEYIHGIDLDTLIRAHEKGRIPPAYGAMIAANVAAALHHAHNLKDLSGQQMNLVHRDISPQNIRISHEGIVKVLDFGIAKATTDPSNTQRGFLKGKYPYLSPEQIRDQEIDGRSDLFALGVVLFEMLTYRRLFKRSTTEATLHAVLHGPIPFPSQVSNTPVSPSLDSITSRLLERDPDSRYQWAREVQADLEAYLRDDPATAADLEGLVRKVFGRAKDPDLLLQKAVAGEELPPPTPTRTPLDSLPTVVEDEPPIFVNAPEEEIGAGVHTYDISGARAVAPSPSAPNMQDSGALLVFEMPDVEIKELPPVAAAEGASKAPQAAKAPAPEAPAPDLSPLAEMVQHGQPPARSASGSIGQNMELEDRFKPIFGATAPVQQSRATAEIPAPVFRPTSPKGSRLPSIIVTGAIVLLLLAAAFFVYKRLNQPSTAAGSIPGAVTTDEQVTFELGAYPQEAEIQIDGVRMTSSSVTLPRSPDRVYVVKVSAPGYVTRVLNLRADQDQRMRIKLVQRETDAPAPKGP